MHLFNLCLYIWLLLTVQRDPSKRRVKPVEKHLLQIHFGMSDDESSDSDFEFTPGAAASDDDLFSDDLEDAEERQEKDAEGKQRGSDNSGASSGKLLWFVSYLRELANPETFCIANRHSMTIFCWSAFHINLTFSGQRCYLQICVFVW